MIAPPKTKRLDTIRVAVSGRVRELIGESFEVLPETVTGKTSIARNPYIKMGDCRGVLFDRVESEFEITIPDEEKEYIRTAAELVSAVMRRFA